MIIRQLCVVFVVAFALNALWENVHAALYVHYKGAPITELVLVRAALFDAFIIFLGACLLLFAPAIHSHKWFIFALLTIFAVGLEVWALGGGRWAYTSAMPLVPFIRVGLTPTIQLALLAYASYWSAKIL